MTRFPIEATWQDDGVHVALYRIEPLTPENAAHLRARGMLRTDDDPVSRVQVGEMRITEPMRMTEKRVRRAALDWLAEHAGMTDRDSFEMRIAVQADLEILAQIEEAVRA